MNTTQTVTKLLAALAIMLVLVGGAARRPTVARRPEAAVVAIA